MKPKLVDVFAWIRLVEAYRGAGLITSPQARVLTILATFTNYADGTGAFPGRARLKQSANAGATVITSAKAIGIAFGMLRVAGEKRRKGGTLTVLDLAWPSDIPAAVAARLVGHVAVDDHELHDVDPDPLSAGPGRVGTRDDPDPLLTGPGNPDPFGGRPGPISPRPGPILGGSRPPTTERSEVVVAGDDAAAPGGAASSLRAAYAAGGAARWLTRFSNAKRRPYHDLGATSFAPLLAEAERLRTLGRLPEVAAAQCTGLPAKPTSPHALIGTRLHGLGAYDLASLLDTITDAWTLAALIVSDIMIETDRLSFLDCELDPDGTIVDDIMPDLLVRCGAYDERSDAVECFSGSQELTDHEAEIAMLIRAFSKGTTDALRTIYDKLPAIVLHAAKSAEHTRLRTRKRPTATLVEEAGP